MRYSVYSDRSGFMETEAAGGCAEALRPGDTMSIEVCTRFLIASGESMWHEPLARETWAGRPCHRKGGGMKQFIGILLLVAGGFTTNFISTMIATAKKKAFGDYTVKPRGTLMLNYALAIVSGVLWYGQYFSFGTGTTKLGE